jgi:hypothetical protein
MPNDDVPVSVSSQQVAARNERSQEVPSDLQDHVPGREFPRVVYISILASFGWVVLASWYAFGSGGGIDLDLGFVTLIFAMFLGIPVILHGVGLRWTHSKPKAFDDFWEHSVGTATGDLPAGQAWIQVLMIPLALAVAATLIGIVHVLS